MNASIRVADLVTQFQAALSSAGAKDLFYYWLEEEYRFIREQGWVWNWTATQDLTFAELTVVETATWVEGNNYITMSAMSSTMTIMTGRKVLLGDEYYRVIDYGLTSALRIYVDRPILGSGTDDLLTFVRDERAIRTTQIRAVHVDGEKLPRVSEDYIHSNFLSRSTLNPSSGTPSVYTDVDSMIIPPPSYPPAVVISLGGTQTAGTYQYFFTRRDPETGLESAPGPVTEFVNTTGKAPNVSYASPAGTSKSEYTSYQLCLYRSQINPSRGRPPMFRINTRLASFVAAFLDDDIGTGGFFDQIIYPPYYDGSYSVVRIWPPPDATRHTLVVQHVNSWGGRPRDEEMLNLGRNDEILELLRIFLTGVLGLVGRNTEQQRSASAIHRAQLAYLLTKSRASADGDAGPENYNSLQPGPSYSDDWVEMLPWKE